MYTSLAPYYDSLMNHVNYHDWLYLIQNILKKFILKEKISIFELGAGTGVLGKLLINSGYEYQASDLSYEMSKIAKKKVPSFVCADAREIPVKKTFDLVIFLYDGINYLENLNDYKKVFKSVASILNNGGYFLFDITTEYNSLTYFHDSSYYEEYNNVSLFRHSYYFSNKHLQYNDFTLFTPSDSNNNLFSKKSETHIQRLFSPIQIKQIIPDKLFNCLGIWDGFSFQKFNKQSERIHFLLKRI